jgi:transposase
MDKQPERNKPNGTWTEEQLRLAVKAVSVDGLPKKTAARMYGIPRQTLQDYIRRLSASDNSGVEKMKNGRPTTLTVEEEEELVIFKSVNTFYDQEAALWLRNHPGRVITELEIGELFKLAYGKAASVQNATSGFEKSGISPFNPDVFKNEDFAAANVTDRPEVDITDEQPMSDISEQFAVRL